MRHLTRLHFDNPAIEGATDLYVSIVDQGNDELGNPLYALRSTSITPMMTLEKQYQLLRYLQTTACFFKVPLGASAVVDIYVPDQPGSSAPKTFEYHVTRAQSTLSKEQTRQALKALHKTFSPLIEIENADYKASSLPGGVTIGEAHTCTAHGDTPCGTSVSIDCPDPATQKAFCNGTTVQCISNLIGPGEPPDEF